jgi:hypothetical protein
MLLGIGIGVVLFLIVAGIYFAVLLPLMKNPAIHD